MFVFPPFLPRLGLQVMISFKIDKQLQTISNYFLFSLAIADLAIGLISMPLFTVSTILGHWPLGPFVCDTWLALDYLASNASVLNLLIISFDRYFSVTRPLTYRAKRTTNRAAFMIAAAWGISLLLWPPWIYSWPYIEGRLIDNWFHRCSPTELTQIFSLSCPQQESAPFPNMNATFSSSRPISILHSAQPSPLSMCQVGLRGQ